MRTFVGLFGVYFHLFSASVQRVSASEEAEEDSSSDVVVLTESSFDDFVAENKFVLAEFYAPWCGHCKALKPEYAKAAAELKNSNSVVKLAMIDATEEKDLASKFEVRGYPTLMWFENGKQTEYDGGRTAADILEWVKEASQPPVKELTGSASPSPKKPLIIFSASAPSPAFTALAEANRKHGDFYYKSVSSSAASITIQHINEKVNSKEFSSVSAATEAELTAFFSSHAFPLFGEINGQSYSRYMDRAKGMVWVLPEVSSAATMNSTIESIRPFGFALAAALPEFSVVYIDTVQFKGAVENMLGVSSFPAIVLHLTAGDKKKFIFPTVGMAEMTSSSSSVVKAVSAWVESAKSGAIKPNYKSEPVPDAASQAAAPVKTVVGLNLAETVFNSEKDVLLGITATWCGHCKKLKPEYEKVAKKVMKEGLDKYLTIANMDGTLNDSPVDEISWQGFPTIFYIKAGTKEVIPFDGGRDAKGIWKWLKNNHSKKHENIFSSSKQTADKTEDAAPSKDEL